MTFEKLYPKVPFQLMNLFCQRRLRNMEPFRRTAEMQSLGHEPEKTVTDEFPSVFLH